MSTETCFCLHIPLSLVMIFFSGRISREASKMAWGSRLRFGILAVRVSFLAILEGGPGESCEHTHLPLSHGGGTRRVVEVQHIHW